MSRKDQHLNGPESQKVYDQAVSLHRDRLKPGRSNKREVVIVRAWQQDNKLYDVLKCLFEVQTTERDDKAEASQHLSQYLGNDIRVRKPLGEVTDRDRIVAETVVQYMMSTCGLSSCRKAMEAGGYKISYPEVED